MRRSLLLIALFGCHDPEDTEETDVPDTEDPGDGKLRFTILHTNDWQSHLVGIGPNAEYSPETTGDDSTRGGIARIKAKVEEVRGSADHPVLLFDAGDWMAGSLFQELRTSHAAELQMMQDLGFDATTFGNHEFDWGPGELGRILDRAAEEGVTVPIVASNTHPNPDDPADDALAAHFDSGWVRPTMTFTLDNGLTVGVFGILGDEAQSIAPATAPTLFDEAAVGAANAVATLQGEGVDVVVGITHNGADEDVTLANEVSGIDVIVGGHSHTPLFEPRQANGTLILQAGSHTKYLGQLDLAFDPASGELAVENYVLHEIDDAVAGDSEAQGRVDGFVQALDDGPVGAMGYSFDQPVLDIPGDVRDGACEESAMGGFVTDAYRFALDDLDPEHPVDAAFEAQGVIRESLYAGNDGVQGFSDVFNVLPLGLGDDGRPGYGLVHFYVNGGELRDACEVTATVAPDYGCSYWFEISGIRCTMDMNWLKTQRVNKVEMWNGADWESIDVSGSDPTLYHIAVDSYVASLLGILDPLTSGALEVVAKDELGVPYASIDEMLVDTDPELPGVQELKLWEALVAYGQSFPDEDGNGVPDLPESYLTPPGRVIGYTE